MPTPSYSDEFKREAVRLVTAAHVPRKRVARDLGIAIGTLRNWIHALAPEGPVVSETLPEAEQLRQLRREVERLRMERDILQKAAGIFSQMPQQP